MLSELLTVHEKLVCRSARPRTDEVFRDAGFLTGIFGQHEQPLHLRALRETYEGYSASKRSPILETVLLPKTMNKIVTLTILAGSIALIVYGINASNSISSDFSHLFNGSPTDKSLWLRIGAPAAAIGMGGVLRRSKST